MAAVGTRSTALTYVYTVGLQKTFAHPDLIIFGIAPPEAEGVLEAIAQRVKAGEPLYEGVMIVGAAPAPLMPRAADVERLELLIPPQLARGRHRYFQIVWPDAKERFPWESGFDRRRLRGQSFLFDLDGAAAADLTSG